MPKNDLSTATRAAAVLATAPLAAATAESVDDLVARVKNPDEAVNGPACEAAPGCGAAAVKPLALLMADPDFETARRAKRALYRVTRHAGRPGANKELAAVEAELLLVLKGDEGASVRREAIRMVSEIGTRRSVAPLADLLANEEVREDARCALTRLPDRKATAALKRAFAVAPEPFKYALADSLRLRGEKVQGYPSGKLVPTKATTVLPLPPKQG